MNYLFPMQKLKPEFKMAQPLPTLFAISPARSGSAGAPEAGLRALRHDELLKLPAPAKTESFVAARNLTA
jgi:hypothetical protein